MKFLTIPLVVILALLVLAWLPMSVVAILTGIWTEDVRWTYTGILGIALYVIGVLLWWYLTAMNRLRREAETAPGWKAPRR